jgi:uncharacterized protein (TIGR03000 family)
MTRRHLFSASLALGMALLLPPAAQAQFIGMGRSGFGFRGGMAVVPVLTPFGAYPLLGPGFYPGFNGFGPGYYPAYYNRAPVTINYYNAVPPSSQPEATTAAPSAPRGFQQSIQEFRNGKPVTPGPAAPAPEKSTPPTNKPARVEVTLPADAELWFDGVKTRQVGPTRHFVTPPLAAGQDYSYEVVATWRDRGQAVSETRQITVRAGDHSTVQFTKAPEETETLTAPKKPKP